MRVVAGTARGRRLAAPRDDAVRPTGDRVREAVFNALHSQGAVVDAAVLDLFAGTGALGIEALSRGAAHATFVECSRAHAALVEDNLATCGFTDRADVVVADAERWLSANVITVQGVVGRQVAVDREVEVPAGWHVGRVRRYAGTVVMLLSPEPGDPGSSRP